MKKIWWYPNPQCPNQIRLNIWRPHEDFFLLLSSILLCTQYFVCIQFCLMGWVHDVIWCPCFSFLGFGKQIIYINIVMYKMYNRYVHKIWMCRYENSKLDKIQEKIKIFGRETIYYTTTLHFMWKSVWEKWDDDMIKMSSSFSFLQLFSLFFWGGFAEGTNRKWAFVHTYV